MQCLSLADAVDPYNSLQLLELGRAIMANLQLEVRSDISVLAAYHPNRAQRFHQLRQRLDPPSTTLEASLIKESVAASDLSIRQRPLLSAVL